MAGRNGRAVNRPVRAIYSYSNARSLRSRGRKRERARAYAASRFGGMRRGFRRASPFASSLCRADDRSSFSFLFFSVFSVFSFSSRPLTFPGFENTWGRVWPRRDPASAGYADACFASEPIASRSRFPSRASNGIENRQAGKRKRPSGRFIDPLSIVSTMSSASLLLMTR